jgi:hypothetical protein
LSETGLPASAGEGAEDLCATALRPGDPGRAAAEAFIATAYARAYGGVIRAHYPLLLAVTNGEGVVRAAAGVRLAAQAPLFLEQYLDAPVEAVASAALGRVVSRRSIGEIGNFASDHCAASARLFLALAAHLAREGCSHAVATVTRRLRSRFERAGFAACALGLASADRLHDGARDWGSYYDCSPEVLMGPVSSAIARFGAAEATCRRRAA